jgi:hypothetical protein
MAVLWHFPGPRANKSCGHITRQDLRWVFPNTAEECAVLSPRHKSARGIACILDLVRGSFRPAGITRAAKAGFHTP